MQKWGYTVAILDCDKKHEPVLDRYGHAGWELVSIIYYPDYGESKAYFKRPVAAGGPVVKMGKVEEDGTVHTLD